MTAQGLEILVVDDNSMNRKVFSVLLKKMGNNVDEAGGGMECLELVRQKKYDLIFMDHLMPVMDGIETLNRMQDLELSLNTDTPVVALTANDLRNNKEFYLNVGFDAFLQKPVLPQSLEALINEL